MSYTSFLMPSPPLPTPAPPNGLRHRYASGAPRPRFSHQFEQSYSEEERRAADSLLMINFEPKASQFQFAFAANAPNALAGWERDVWIAAGSR